jgi:hypothetical protein
VNIDEIIELLEAERQRLTKAIAILSPPGHRGSPKATYAKRQQLSAAARKRISTAQRKRWAALKNKKKDEANGSHAAG